MPVERQAISRSQLCELLGIEPAKFIAIERDRDNLEPGRWWIVTEGPEDTCRPVAPSRN